MEYKEVEKRLYNYYINKTKIKNLEKEIESIEKQIKDTEDDLANTNVRIKPEEISISWDERVQTSPTGEGYPERELERQITLLEESLKWLKAKEIDKIIYKNKLKIEVNRITYILEGLEKEKLKFIEMKYRDKYSAEEIAAKLNIVRRTVYRMRDSIVEEVGKLLS